MDSLVMITLAQLDSVIYQTWVGFGFSNPKSEIQIQNPGFWSGFKILFSKLDFGFDLNPFFAEDFEILF